MPIYVYECQECRAREERLQKISDPPPTECKACGKDTEMKKVPVAPGIDLKGHGWYADGYSTYDQKMGKK